MTAGMRIGIGVSEDLPLSTQQDVARVVEEAGHHSLWTNEARGRDALLVCQAWAQATTTLAVGVGVAPIWTRSPAQLAMAAATLQEASGGRFLLGLGVSHPETMRTWHGAEYRKPLAAARDTLDILSPLFAGRETDLDGRVMGSHGFRLGIHPLPPPPLVYLAAMGPKMLALAGERADGVLLNWSTPEEVGNAVARARAGAAASPDGRTPSGLDVAAYVRIAVASDPDAARRALARQFGRYCALPAYAEHFSRQGLGTAVDDVKRAYRGGGPDAVAEAVPDTVLERVGWYGTPDDVPTPLARYAAGGLDHLVARVVVVGDDAVASVRDVSDALARLPRREPI